MFTYTTKKIKYFKPQDEGILETAYTKFNESKVLFDTAKIIDLLENRLDEQILYTHNKEYLYTNCNRIKRRFYHYRDENKHPRITICVLYDIKDQIACRGISMCSLIEQPIKEDGRDRAENRAIAAYKTQLSSEPIIKFEAAQVSECSPEFNEEVKEEFKSAYNVNLTEFEKRLFQIKGDN